MSNHYGKATMPLFVCAVVQKSNTFPWEILNDIKVGKTFKEIIRGQTLENYQAHDNMHFHHKLGWLDIVLCYFQDRCSSVYIHHLSMIFQAKDKQTLRNIY